MQSRDNLKIHAATDVDKTYIYIYIYAITILQSIVIRIADSRLFRFHHSRTFWRFLFDGRKKGPDSRRVSLSLSRERPCQARRATLYDSSLTKISTLSSAARDKRDTLRNIVYFYPLHRRTNLLYRRATNMGNGNTFSHDACMPMRFYLGDHRGSCNGSTRERWDLFSFHFTTNVWRK